MWASFIPRAVVLSYCPWSSWADPGACGSFVPTSRFSCLTTRPRGLEHLPSWPHREPSSSALHLAGSSCRPQDWGALTHLHGLWRDRSDLTGRRRGAGSWGTPRALSVDSWIFFWVSLITLDCASCLSRVVRPNRSPPAPCPPALSDLSGVHLSEDCRLHAALLTSLHLSCWNYLVRGLHLQNLHLPESRTYSDLALSGEAIHRFAHTCVSYEIGVQQNPG